MASNIEIGNLVEVTYKNEVLQGVIEGVARKTVVVKFADGESKRIPRNSVTLIDASNDEGKGSEKPRKRGRPSMKETLSVDEIQAQVDALLEELAESNADEDIPRSKKIRSKLRDRGHRGGLTGVKSTVVSRITHEAVTGEPIA